MQMQMRQLNGVSAAVVDSNNKTKKLEIASRRPGRGGPTDRQQPGGRVKEGGRGHVRARPEREKEQSRPRGPAHRVCFSMFRQGLRASRKTAGASTLGQPRPGRETRRPAASRLSVRLVALGAPCSGRGVAPVVVTRMRGASCRFACTHFCIFLFFLCLLRMRFFAHFALIFDSNNY